MKLKRLSSNIDSFRTINFNDSFNVIVGDPHSDNDGRSHNLGKTTVLKLIKFILFNGSKTFLNKIEEKFPQAQFTIDYISNNKEFNFTRGFARRKSGEQKEVETSVDYEYFLRLQDEFDIESPFKKSSFKGKDLYWKPRLIGLLGFDEALLQKKLQLASDIKELESAIKAIKNSNTFQLENETDISSLHNQKNTIIQSIRNLKLFDSDNADLNILVNEIDAQIFEIKPKIYKLRTELRKITQALSRLPKMVFDISRVEEIFKQVKLYFGEQIKNDVRSLNDFYTYMYSSRKKVLERQKEIINFQLTNLEQEAEKLDERRSLILTQLATEDSKRAYEEKYNELIEIEKKLALLNQNSMQQNIKALEEELSRKQTLHMQAATNVSRNIDESRVKFEEINKIYTDIMQRTLKIDAEIRITKKGTGNLDIITQSYRNGNESDELKGDTAKKISAAAIDIAIRCIQNEDFGFIAQDSVIDNIDKNGAREFVNVVKELASKYKFQYIMTALKENLPDNIISDDVIIELNDATPSGLLMGFVY